MSNLNIFVVALAVLLILTGSIGLEIGSQYYQILRWVVPITCILLAFNLKNTNPFVFITYFVIAVLFNPFTTIYLSHDIWKIIYIVIGILFILSVKITK